MSKKIRAHLIVKSDQGYFHIATIAETNNGSVIITLPKSLKISEKHIIDTSTGKPNVTSITPISVENMHVSYHPNTGFKHIKVLVENVEERVFTENANRERISEGYLEHLLRIVPSLPEKHPAVKNSTAKRIIIDMVKFDHMPIMIIISVTDRKHNEIKGEGPEKCTATYTKLKQTSIIVTTTLATQNDVLLEKWPEDTMWYSPY